MKIERIDDKTVKCFLSNEELEEYEIDYKDFVMRSEKAKVVVQEIIEQAEEEVGYKPPKFAFDLQIMMLPDQGLLLTFSEKEPLEGKDGEQIIEALREMKRALQKTKEQLKSEGQNLPAGSTSTETGAAPKKPEFAVFAFRNIGRVMEFAAALPGNLRVKSALYLMDGLCYLHMEKGSASYERYSRACIQAMEFGNLYAADEERILYLQEHGDCLIAEKALKKLRG